MKLQKFEALEKQLKEAHPAHLSSIYLIASSQPEERKRLIESVGQLIRDKQPATLFKRASNLQEAVDFVRAPSLFGEILLSCADLQKEEAPLLGLYARAPAQGTHLIVGIENGKIAAELYQSAMREVVLLDLLQESPSAHRHRLLHWGQIWLQKEKKQMAPVLLEKLLEQVELDWGLFEQELEKLVCYVGSQETIHQEDLNAISVAALQQVGGFKLAEQLIEGSYHPPYRISDLTQLLLLLGQLRYLFEQGLRLTTQLQRGEKPYDKNLALMSRRRPPFFVRALQSLFELELAAKQSLGTPQLLFDRFCTQVLIP